MAFSNSEMMYEFDVKASAHSEALRQFADHTVREIKTLAGWDADVRVTVEPNRIVKGHFAVSMSVFGLDHSVFVRKEGRNLIAVFRKVRNAVLRSVQRQSKRRMAKRRRRIFSEQFAS